MQGTKRRSTVAAQPKYMRASDRFNAEMPVEVNGIKGLTRNISATGVYFVVNTANAELGTPVSLTLEVTMGGEKLQLVCEGQIVRVEPPKRDGSVGIAARLHNSFFENADEYTDTSTLDTVPASLEH